MLDDRPPGPPGASRPPGPRRAAPPPLHARAPQAPASYATATAPDGRYPAYAEPAPHLFDERPFVWPDPPGNPKHEAMLPWFSFRHRDEAARYLRLVAAVQTCVLIGLLNMYVLHIGALGLVMMVVGMTINMRYTRLWIDLCKRAHPPVPRWNWYVSGPLHRRTRHAISQALATLRPE